MAMRAGSAATCFTVAGDGFLHMGEEYNKWLRCVFKAQQVSTRCVELACKLRDEL